MKSYSLGIFKPTVTLLLSMAVAACGGGIDGATPANNTATNTASDSSADTGGPTMTTLGLRATYSVGGKVGGMDAGKTIVLVNKGTNAISLSANGVFVFPKEWTRGTTYNVSVGALPAGQICEMVRPSGSIQGWNITDVRVFCTPTDGSLATYDLGGMLAGLGSGKTVVLQDGAGHAMNLSASGVFTFPTPLANGTAYAVSVATQPVGQTCTVGNSGGSMNSGDVDTVSVACVDNLVPTYSVGGTLSGLGAGKSVVLSNNGGDNLSLSASGVFTFATRLLNGAAYNVAVVTQPAGQTCAVSSGTGAINLAPVASVGVVCMDNVASTFSVGGTLSGLGAGKSVVLRNNAGDSLSLSASGAFTFATRLTNGAAYAVTVLTQPTGQTCAVSNGSGNINVANVANVGVACVDNTVTTYSVGGNLSGLGAGKSVVLRNNGGDSLSVGASGTFAFATRLTTGATYAVAVLTQPVGQSCTVSGGSGTIAATNVTNVAVACVAATVDAWSNFSTTANTLTLTSSEPLKANSPFFGIEVRKNGVDITDDIVNVEVLSTTSWRYTFGTEVMNTSGSTISISLQNRALATPGHYLTIGSGQAATVQKLYQTLLDCQAGTGACAGRGALPGLVASVKGMSERYSPRDIETSQGVYNFSNVFSDAAFLASKGKKLHVMFTVKSFGTNTFYDGNGTKVAFDIPRAADGGNGWDGVRPREVHVEVKDSAGHYVETNAFQFNASRTQVVLNTPPPAGAKRVLIVYSRDPFPEYAWQMNPPVAGWFAGEGGQNTDSAASGAGSHGFVHAPWRATTVTWMRNFMAAFKTQWTTAIANGLPDTAIESISIQETANPLSVTDAAYTPAGYRAGLLEYSKANAKAARRRGLHGQLFNMIPGGNQVDPVTKMASMQTHANNIVLWGGRLEGPDLFNNEQALETNVYENVHRALHDKAMTMIWHQNASFAERVGTTNAFYTPAQQFAKAQRAIDDTSTPSGTRGIEAEYVFWNTTTKAPLGSPQTWLDALPVIANNATIQSAGNDRTLWKRAINNTPIGDQSLSKVNP